MMPRPRILSLKQWFEEPLVHFLVAGLALFVLYRGLNPQLDAERNHQRIEVTEDDLRQFDHTWMAHKDCHPTLEEIRTFVDSRVREEIFYREALALGLDQTDAVVKQRLAKKMELLAEDAFAIGDPDSGALQVWFEKNSARFTLPGQVTFRQLYFSTDKREKHARDDAERALATLAGKPKDWAEAAALADDFVYQYYFRDRSRAQVSSVFGIKFATTLFQLKRVAWQGPIESVTGWHLVWVDSLTPDRVPSLDEVESSLVVA